MAPVGPGLELWGPGTRHFLPSHSSPRFRLSICFSRLFAKRKSVCLVCFFGSSFLLRRVRVEVHVHRASTVPPPPGHAVSDTTLAGCAHIPEAPAYVSSPNWQGPAFI